MNILSWFQKPKEPTYKETVNNTLQSLYFTLLEEEQEEIRIRKNVELLKARISFLESKT